MERFWKKVRKSEQCWEWTAALGPNGYGQFRWMIDGRWTHAQAHRVAWEMLRGPIPVGLWVLHKCDVRFCVNPDHLFLGTAQDNMDDKYRKGRQRHPFGINAPRVKLNDDLVRQIRIDPRTTREIGRDYGIAGTAVSKIKLRRTWAHVKGN